MEHLLIHKKVNELDVAISEYAIENDLQIGTSDSVKSLLYSVLVSTSVSLDNISETIENETSFCSSCFYTNLDKIRKSVEDVSK
jgi:hypothetical protein